MTDRDRLIELLEQADNKCANTIDCGECEQHGKGEKCINNHLADYLLANGVIVPPCKVGDIVYFHHIIGTNEDGSPIEEVRAGTIYKIQIEKDNQIWLGVSFGIWYCCRPYTDFYLTKEEAEEKLKELK